LYWAPYHEEDTVLQFAEAFYGLYAGEQEGQGLVEYALIIAFIAILVIVALIFLREQISTLFSRVGNSLQ
jgi:pilus assembly protein Flp/PilA